MNDQSIPDHKIDKLPQPPELKRMIGPSLILLGLGLGSGEVILWPYLSSNFGLGIIWAAAVGITLQFFLNMEVERYALIRGESVFVGFCRLWRPFSIWFIVSTFIGFGWPGIIASAAKILSAAFGIERFDLLAIVLLITIGLILSLGPVLYKTLENYQKITISIGIPVIMVLAFLIAKSFDWQSLLAGLLGRGGEYWFLPKGIPLFTFLGALAYAGAGGNLNLAQSFYVKDKGYAMGAYSGRIQSLITGEKEDILLTGSTFEPTSENLLLFKKWWRLVNIEHFLVFWGLGLFTILLLSLLSFATTYSLGDNSTGIDFIISESQVIAEMLLPAAGILFLLVSGVLLFGTQLTVMDSTSRIICENFVLFKHSPAMTKLVPKIYYAVLWSQILFGIIIFLIGFSEPRTLVVLGAVFNALAMFVSFALMLYLNNRSLPKELRPGLIRRSILWLAFLFFGVFSILAIGNSF